MLYTYQHRIEGQLSSYLEFVFDKILSNRPLYRSWSSQHFTISPQERGLMDAVAGVKGVISDNSKSPSASSSELINLNGNRLLVKISEIDPKKISILTQTIVKRVQRRIAPNESRKRVHYATLQKALEKLNAKTWGV